MTVTPGHAAAVPSADEAGEKILNSGQAENRCRCEPIFVTIPDFSRETPDLSLDVPDFSLNCVSLLYTFIPDFFRERQDFPLKSSRGYLTVLDCSLVRTSVKNMIIGDWRLRSTQKATKSHLPTIPDFSLKHT